MKHILMVSGVVCVLTTHPAAYGQLSIHPYSESFDSSDTVPSGWNLVGFELSSSVPRSSPNCILSRGNMDTHSVATELIDPAVLSLKALHWYERRSGSALSFDLMVSFLTEEGSIVLARFDSMEVDNSYRLRSIDLSPFAGALSHPGRFRFEIQPDSTNSTGVVRLDDVWLDIESRYDLSVSAVPPSFSPQFVGEEQLVTFRIRNEKPNFSEAAFLEVFDHPDGVASPATHRSFSILPLEGYDSIDIQYPFETALFGLHRVYGELIWWRDQDRSNDTSSVSIPVGYPPSSVIVTEFMFSPLREDEPEWIEIFNPGPAIIDGGQLWVSDKGLQRTRVSADNFLLAPGEYAAISSSSALSDLYEMDGVRWCTARFSALNNTTPDAVVIRDGWGSTLDSVLYDPAWGEPGRSLERRDWNLPSGLQSSWLPSISPQGGTPGQPNTVERLDIDGALRDLGVVWSEHDSRADISIEVANIGRTLIPEGTIRLLQSGQSSPIGELAVETLMPGEERSFHMVWVPRSSGTQILTISLDIPGDQNSTNNSGNIEFEVPHTPGSVIVNEIMFDPSPGESEWIEVLNSGEQEVSLDGWIVTDLPSPSGGRTSARLETTLSLPPGGLAIIAGDSSLFRSFPWLQTDPYRGNVLLLNRAGGLGLNADNDGVILIDRTGHTIDSVLYDDEWHHPALDTKGRSLERIRIDLPGTLQRTWTSAPGPYRGSPARTNLALPPEQQQLSHFSVSPNPFSPDGDGHDDMTFIRYAYPSASLFVRARLFDDTGREIRTLSHGALFSGSDLIMWNGTDDAGKRVRRGPYILLLEAWNSESSFSVTEKQVVVVAR